jgi:hypothetical protein
VIETGAGVTETGALVVETGAFATETGVGVTATGASVTETIVDMGFGAGLKRVHLTAIYEPGHWPAGRCTGATRLAGLTLRLRELSGWLTTTGQPDC